MKCQKCDFDNREGAKFCKKCGTILEIRCPSCGHPYQTDSVFCDECGCNLQEPEKITDIDYSEPKSYTPKFLTEKILTSRSSLEGERKIVTVLFADVANYTALSERLDPEEVHQIMDGCFKILMDEIHTYEGTINQFTGDGVMALFGAPMSHEDHAQRACHAALAIRKAIATYSQKIKNDYSVEFIMRMGLNSGLVIVGSIGNDLRMDYTAVGDTTNLAARMEGMAKPGTVLISKNTYKIVRDYFEFNSIGKVQVKGKEAHQEAYELIKPSKIETRIHAASVKGLTKFVGRKSSITILQGCFDKTQTGSGQVVGIVGDAGVGKSRLLLELRNIIPEDEYTYLEGRCLHYGRSIAYLPILDLLKSFFDIKDGDREFIIKNKIKDAVTNLDEKLNSIIPPFQEILSLKVDDKDFVNLEPPQKREKTYEALRDLLIRESQNRSLVLAIEDIHWIDKTSEAFINYLINWPANCRILLILLYRPEYIHQWGSRSYYTKIGLDQLSTTSSAELVQAILKESEVVPELRELILNRAAGNPLFMEEFTQTLLENGSIHRENNKYILSRETTDIQVPDTIQGIIAARMDRLEDNLKQIMQVASVIGRGFSFRILQTITGLREDLKSSLLNLQCLEFIYEKSLFPELEYIFKHALIQEVAYNSLLLARRKEIHEKIGKAIENIYADRLEEFYEMLAHHYSKSGNTEKAYYYLTMSGMKAGLKASLWEAFRYSKEAIKALNNALDTEENNKKGIEVRYLMATLAAALSFPEDSLQIFQEGEKLSRELGDERSLASFQSSIGLCFSFQGNPIEGIKYGEDALQIAENMEDIELIATVGNELCTSYMIEGRFLNITKVIPRILAMLEKTGRESKIFGRGYNFNIYSALLTMHGCALGYLGHFKKGEALCKKGLGLALEINNIYSICIAEYNYGQLLYLKGDGKDAAEHLQHAVGFAEQGQMAGVLHLFWTSLGLAYHLMGDLENARELGERCFKSQANPEGLANAYLLLGLVHLYSDDLTRARSDAMKAIELSYKRNEKLIEGESRILLGRILGKLDKSQDNEAEKYVLQGTHILDELQLKPSSAVGYLYLGELYADTDQKEKVIEPLKKAEEMCREMGIDYWPAKIQEVLDRL